MAQHVYKDVTYNTFTRLIRMSTVDEDTIRQMEDAMERGCRENKLVCMSSDNKKVEFGHVFADNKPVWLMSADTSSHVCVNVYDRNEEKKNLCTVWMDPNDSFEFVANKAQSILRCGRRKLETFIFQLDEHAMTDDTRDALEKVIMGPIKSLCLTADVKAEDIAPKWRVNTTAFEERVRTAWAEAESLTPDPINGAIHSFFHTQKSVQGLYTPISKLLKHFTCHLRL